MASIRLSTVMLEKYRPMSKRLKDPANGLFLMMDSDKGLLDLIDTALREKSPKIFTSSMTPFCFDIHLQQAT